MKNISLKSILCFALCAFFLSNVEMMAQNKDWARLGRYAKANQELPAPTKKDKRVVFMGNSITEGWVRIRPDFFKENGYIGRGISGQTSYQRCGRDYRSVRLGNYVRKHRVDGRACQGQ